jgi:hypothetical protein
MLRATARFSKPRRCRIPLGIICPQIISIVGQPSLTAVSLRRVMMEMPPLGLRPRFVVTESRFAERGEAMHFNLSERIAHCPELVGLPPLGLRSRLIVVEQRFAEIDDAIKRYLSAYMPIPVEWIEERNDIIEYLRKRDETKTD